MQRARQELHDVQGAEIDGVADSIGARAVASPADGCIRRAGRHLLTVAERAPVAPVAAQFGSFRHFTIAAIISNLRNNFNIVLIGFDSLKQIVFDYLNLNDM